MFSFRSAGHRWDPRRQRPEMWQLLNGRLGPGETVRVFPLSNWTEKDVWRYIAREQLDVVPLYFAAERPTIVRNGSLLVLDDDRMPLRAGESVARRQRALPHAGLLAADGGVDSDAARHRQRGGGDARRPRLRAPAVSSTTTKPAPWSARSRKAISDAGAAQNTPPQPRASGQNRTASAPILLHPSAHAAPKARCRDDLAGSLHVLTCGSVDDGKSTLIGRMLWDARALHARPAGGMQKSAEDRGAAHPDFSRLVDGLAAEREQGITIDMAWRYFDTRDRRLVIIDSPGHEQYTRNMATGASHADVAILLVDARSGVKEQTRRHARSCT